MLDPVECPGIIDNLNRIPRAGRADKARSQDLKARDFDQVRRILSAAFGSNDFDSFELKMELFPGETIPADPSGFHPSHRLLLSADTHRLSTALPALSR